MSNLQEKYDLELTNKDDIIADLQNRLDTALRSDDFKEKYEYLGKNLEFAWVKKSQSMTEAFFSGIVPFIVQTKKDL